MIQNFYGVQTIRGEPYEGKTHELLKQAIQKFKDGKKVLIISPEDLPDLLMFRVLEMMMGRKFPKYGKDKQKKYLNDAEKLFRSYVKKGGRLDIEEAWEIDAVIRFSKKEKFDTICIDDYSSFTQVMNPHHLYQRHIKTNHLILTLTTYKLKEEKPK